MRDWRQGRIRHGCPGPNPDTADMPRLIDLGGGGPSPLTTCAGAIQGASRRILDVERPAINGRLLASGIAWGNTEHQRRWR